MGEFLKTYQNITDKDKERRDAFFYFNDKYFRDPYKNEFPFSSDERIYAKDLPMVPGKIYTFQYDPLYKDRLYFWDAQPMLLVLEAYVKNENTGNILIKGLNLNFIPEFARVVLLDAYMEATATEQKRYDKQVTEGKVGILPGVYSFFSNPENIHNLFNRKTAVGYQFLYRQYLPQRMKNRTLVEQEDWMYIPFYVGKEYQGLPAAQIFKDYVTKRTELIKKPLKKKA